MRRNGRLDVVAATAGMSASALARYQQFVPALDQPTAVALLRGRARCVRRSHASLMAR
ncbi:hypothetical protein [Nonomuraea sp. B1E8]|uniref:hypothetical protein n=1 Tax=unclassified Nonomuraea TaxID=2593643 RepID=UPI00325DFD0C